MVWVRTSDDVPLQRRHRALSPSANWLLHCLLCYSNRELTDGVVDPAELPILVQPGAKPKELGDALAELERAGAVQSTPEGLLQVVWLLDEQPTAADVQARRAKDRDRQQRRRDREPDEESQAVSRRDTARDTGRDSTVSHAAPSRPDPVPIPSRPDPTQRSLGDPSACETARAHARGASREDVARDSQATRGDVARGVACEPIDTSPPDGPALALLRGHIRLDYEQRLFTKTTALPPKTPAVEQALSAVTRWVWETAAARGEEPFPLASRLLEAFFASPKAREAGFKLTWLANDPMEFLAPPRGPQRGLVGMSDVSAPGEQADEPEPEFMQHG